MAKIRLIIWLKRIGWSIAAIVLLVAAAMSFCINSTTQKKAQAFADAVARWQHNPDFRTIIYQYSDLGSAGVQSRAWFWSGRDAIMTFRKLPGLPPLVAINAGSLPHYDDFDRGPIAAYLCLTGEQTTADGINRIQQLGPIPSDDAIQQFLTSFKDMPFPVVTDAGALASVRRMLADVNPSQPFTIPTNLTDELTARIQSLAATKEMSDVDHLPHTDQMALLTRLDTDLQTSNPQLWRTKRANDFLAGVWAQVYGQIYATAIPYVILVRFVSRIVLVVGIAAIASYLVSKKIRAQRRRDAEESQRNPK